MHVKRAKTLKPSQIRHLLRAPEATSRHRERDALILLLGFTCGMRVSEIARIEVADVMLPGGKLREEVSLRAANGARSPPVARPDAADDPHPDPQGQRL